MRRQQDQEELGAMQTEVSSREEQTFANSRKRTLENAHPYSNGNGTVSGNHSRGKTIYSIYTNLWLNDKCDKL